MSEISKILSQARDQKGWSIEELSDRTKIRKAIIKNIEEGNFEEFQEVYLRAYIRSLAKELKLFGNEDFIDAYNSLTNTITIKSKTEDSRTKLVIDDTSISTSQPKQSPKTEASSYNPESNAFKLFKTNPKINLNFVIYTVLFLLLGLLLFVTFYPLTKIEEQIPEQGISAAQSDKKTEEEPAKQEEGNSLLQFFQKSDSLRLNAQVTDSVWITILIDNKDKVQAILLPNQSYSWSAMEKFIVTHGNAGSIKFWLEDKELEPFAPPGYIAKDVVITKNEVINPNYKRIDSLRKSRKKQQKEEKNEFRMIEPSPIRN